MLSISENADLPSFLANCVKQLRIKHPRYSDAQLAKIVKVAGSTIFRLGNKEIMRPTFETSFALVRAVGSDEVTHTFFARFFPDMEEMFQRLYAGNSDAAAVDNEAEEYFENPMTFELMMRATTQSGVNANEIRNTLGENAVQVLEKMRAINLLKFENGFYYLDGKINATQATVQKLILNLIRHSYDLENFGPARNMLTLQYESVNKEKVYGEIRQIIDNSRQRVRDLFNDPENKGSDVVWFSIAMDTLQMNNDSLGVLQ